MAGGKILGGERCGAREASASLAHWAKMVVLDWLLRIDGFAAAAKVEDAVVARVARWLESFDPGD